MKNVHFLLSAFVLLTACGKASLSCTEADLAAQEYVKSKLKSPSKADFPMYPDACEVVSDSIYRVRSHVDHQNAFGATVRTEYVDELHYQGGQASLAESWKHDVMMVQ